MLGLEISYTDFQYVVERRKPDRICFGSKVARDTNPIGKGLSPFQRRFANEIFVNITPQTYHIEHLTSGVAKLHNKIRSKKGVGGLSNRAPRFYCKTLTRVPSPTRYDPEPFHKQFEQNRIPFGQVLGRTSKKTPGTPCPGTYTTTVKLCKRTKFDYNFGRPRMVPAVEVVCVPVPSHTCDMCEETCTDDYWHKDYELFLCHACMMEERILHEDHTKAQLKEYAKIRTCWYKHSHEGTTAAVQLLPRNRLVKKERLENYLALFVK